MTIDLTPQITHEPKPPWPCKECGDLMVASNQFTRRGRKTFRCHKGRGLCARCHRRWMVAQQREREGYRPTGRMTREELRAEWELIAPTAGTRAERVRVVAERLGKTHASVDRLLYRAGIEVAA